MSNGDQDRPTPQRLLIALGRLAAILLAILLYTLFPVLPQSLAFRDNTLHVTRPGPDRPMYTEDGQAIVEPGGRAWIKRGSPIPAPDVLVIRIAGRNKLSPGWGGSHWPRRTGSSKTSNFPARGLEISSARTDNDGRVEIAANRGLAVGSWSPFGGGSAGPLLAAIVYSPGRTVRVVWPRYEAPLEKPARIGTLASQPIYRLQPSFKLLSPFDTESCDFLRAYWEHETPSGQTVRALAVRDIQTWGLELDDGKTKRAILELAYEIERAKLDDASLTALTQKINDTLELYAIGSYNRPVFCDG